MIVLGVWAQILFYNDLFCWMHHLEELCVVYLTILVNICLVNDHLHNNYRIGNVKRISTHLDLLLSQ